MVVEVFEVTIEVPTTSVETDSNITTTIDADCNLTEVVEVVSSVNMATVLEGEWILEEL